MYLTNSYFLINFHYEFYLFDFRLEKEMGENFHPISWII